MPALIPLMPAIIAQKLGMTQLFLEDGTVAKVTVLQAGPCPITAVRTAERDGYDAVQLAFGQTRQKRLSRPELGHLTKAGAPPMRHLVEFRTYSDGKAAAAAATPLGEAKIGDTVTVESFQPGMVIKVSGISKGKGFQGTVKRHGFGRGPKSHGSHNVRAPGSIGASAFPARVFKGIRGPGQMGNRRVTQRGLKVVSIDAQRNLLLVAGSVPGPRGGVVEVRGDA